MIGKPIKSKNHTLRSTMSAYTKLSELFQFCALTGSKAIVLMLKRASILLEATQSFMEGGFCSAESTGRFKEVCKQLEQVVELLEKIKPNDEDYLVWDGKFEFGKLPATIVVGDREYTRKQRPDCKSVTYRLKVDGETVDASVLKSFDVTYLEDAVSYIALDVDPIDNPDQIVNVVDPESLDLQYSDDLGIKGRNHEADILKIDACELLAELLVDFSKEKFSPASELRLKRQADDSDDDRYASPKKVSKTLDFTALGFGDSADAANDSDDSDSEEASPRCRLEF